MEIDKVFTYHAPNQDQIKRYEDLRNMAKEIAHWIAFNTKQSHEQTQALDKLRECVMWANAGIAINECKAALHEPNEE